jgi:hypothetical protein
MMTTRSFLNFLSLTKYFTTTCYCSFSLRVSVYVSFLHFTFAKNNCRSSVAALHVSGHYKRSEMNESHFCQFTLAFRFVLFLRQDYCGEFVQKDFFLEYAHTFHLFVSFFFYCVDRVSGFCLVRLDTNSFSFLFMNCLNAS